MGEHSKIEWTHHTFNPWWGCVKVSPGCDHCYAERDSLRYGHQVWGKDSVRRELSAHHWRQPELWNRKAQAAGERHRVFCGSMCDVMEEGSHLQEIRERQLYPLIEATPHLDWLLLSKRPQNFRRFLPAGWLEAPMPNVWGMTSVESAEYLWRVKELLRTRFAMRALSVEPLLGLVDVGLGCWIRLPRRVCSDLPWDRVAVSAGVYCAESNPHGALSVRAEDGRLLGVKPDEFERLPSIDWVIVGGESGPGARPMHPDWARSLRDQCVAAGVPFFFKQWGEWGEVDEAKDGRDHVTEVALRPLPSGPRECFVSRRGDVIWTEAEMVNDVSYRWMRRVGKHAAGALLDGREWRELPAK